MSEYNVGEIPPEQLKKQAKRYGLEDFVKGRVDDETLNRIAYKADELQRKNLSEGEKAVEKLKAWRRLKDKGFRFNGVGVYDKGMLEIDGVLPALEEANKTERSKIVDDLHLIFGEEEE